MLLTDNIYIYRAGAAVVSTITSVSMNRSPSNGIMVIL